MQKMVESSSDTIGKTPLLKLKKVTEGLHATVALKLEYMNPSSSVKDRIALHMVEHAEKAGYITPGKTVLIEPTSGNLGVALAQVAAYKGYKLILCLSCGMSVERRAMAKAYGAEIILTEPCLNTRGAIERTYKIASVVPNSFVLNQFANHANSEAHFKSTGPEIWEQTDGKVDIVVFGVGSGGTVTGVGRYLKKQKPSVQVYAMEPYESSLINGLPQGVHKIQGIGSGIVPAVLDKSILSACLRVKSDDAVAMSKRLAKEEGLLVGISSGANVCAAIELAKKPENAGKLIVTTASSFGERYLSSLYADIREEVSKMTAMSESESIERALAYVNRV